MILCKHCGILLCMYTLNVPPCILHWPEDGFVKLKHVAKITNVLVVLCSDGINHFISLFQIMVVCEHIYF